VVVLADVTTTGHTAYSPGPGLAITGGVVHAERCSFQGGTGIDGGFSGGFVEEVRRPGSVERPNDGQANRLSAPALFADELASAFDTLSMFTNAGPPTAPARVTQTAAGFGQARIQSGSVWRLQRSNGVHHKRKRTKARRAGCLLCKPNKLGQGTEHKLGRRGFGNLRRERSSGRDLREFEHRGFDSWKKPK
jgi:hypothetical protein